MRQYRKPACSILMKASDVTAHFDLDLFVIGGGSGGVRAARLAAEAGYRVALAEADRVGGTCVVRGCVPKKLMVYASAFSQMFEDARAFGWDVGPARFDWARFAAARNAEVDRLEVAYRNRLDKAGVQILAGRAMLSDPHFVRLDDGRTFSARHILIATGGKPLRPDLPGVGLAITSDEVFHLPDLPRRTLIVGGGYIACEFAGILNGLESQVTLIHRGDMILRGFDRDLRLHLTTAAKARGIDLRTGTELVSISQTATGQLVQLSDGSSLEVDAVLLAIGRAPNTQGLGLQDCGVETGPNGSVRVDQWSQSNVPSIFAVGDVTDRVQLTPVAIREAVAFVETVFHGRATTVDHATVAHAVFSQPEIASVGLSEEEARKAGPVRVYLSSFKPMASAFAGRNDRMMMKLVTTREEARILGAHLAGPGAAEMIQLIAIAMGMGATKADLDRTIAVHPTSAEELVTMGEALAEQG